MAEPTPARRRNMAAIRGKNTRPERLLRSAVFARGLRFRLHVRSLPGSPDLVFPKFKAAVFVHGCFWHRHRGCRFTTKPKNNASFWLNKFTENVRRDRGTRNRLISLGWRIAVVWECAIKESPDAAAALLHAWLTSEVGTILEVGAPGLTPG